MNRDDQFGAREDIVKSQLHFQAADASASARQLEKETVTIQSLGVKLKNKDQMILQLRAQLDALTEQNNEAVVVAKSAVLALGDAISTIAEVTKAPKEIVTQKFNQEIRSLRYDQAVIEALNKGELKVDPRATEKMKARKWYVPGLT